MHFVNVKHLNFILISANNITKRTKNMLPEGSIIIIHLNQFTISNQTADILFIIINDRLQMFVIIGTNFWRWNYMQLVISEFGKPAEKHIGYLYFSSKLHMFRIIFSQMQIIAEYIYYSSDEIFCYTECYAYSLDRKSVV